MRTRKFILWAGLLVACAWFSGCTTLTSLKTPGGFVREENSEDAERWRLLTGNWYGKQRLRDQSIREWLTTRHADGTYRTVFLSAAPDGQIVRTIEIGEWGVSGNIYFEVFKGWMENSAFKPVSPQDHATRDAYRVLSLSELRFRYASIETNDEFRVIRVTDGYEI